LCDEEHVLLKQQSSKDKEAKQYTKWRNDTLNPCPKKSGPENQKSDFSDCGRIFLIMTMDRIYARGPIYARKPKKCLEEHRK